MKAQSIDFIKEHKLIAIARGLNDVNICDVAAALFDGGVRLLEVTFDQTDSENLITTPKLIEMLNKNFGGKMLIGAGTVMSKEQCEAAYSAGAKYIISPHTDAEIIRYTNEKKLVSLPGAFTPTEVASAYSYGADFVKLFPAGNLGVNYIKAIKAPLKHIPMLAVGGVDENNIREFMQTGICGVGVGDKLIKPDFVKAGDFAAICENARKFTGQLYI